MELSLGMEGDQGESECDELEEEGKKVGDECMEERYLNPVVYVDRVHSRAQSFQVQCNRVSSHDRVPPEFCDERHDKRDLHRRTDGPPSIRQKPLE